MVTKNAGLNVVKRGVFFLSFSKTLKVGMKNVRIFSDNSQNEGIKLVLKYRENNAQFLRRLIPTNSFWFHDFDFIFSISFCRFYLDFKLKFSTIPI